jgi:hypothetical protein
LHSFSDKKKPWFDILGLTFLIIVDIFNEGTKMLNHFKIDPKPDFATQVRNTLLAKGITIEYTTETNLDFTALVVQHAIDNIAYPVTATYARLCIKDLYRQHVEAIVNKIENFLINNKAALEAFPCLSCEVQLHSSSDRGYKEGSLVQTEWVLTTDMQIKAFKSKVRSY